MPAAQVMICHHLLAMKKKMLFVKLLGMYAGRYMNSSSSQGLLVKRQ